MVQPKKESFRFVEKKKRGVGRRDGEKQREKETGKERGKVSTHIFFSG